MSRCCCHVIIVGPIVGGWWALIAVGGVWRWVLVAIGGCSSGALVAFSGWSCWVLIAVGGWWCWALSVVGEGVVLGTRRCWCHSWVVCCHGHVVVLSHGVILLSLWHGCHLLWLWLWSVVIVISCLLSKKMTMNVDVVRCLVAM